MFILSKLSSLITDLIADVISYFIALEKRLTRAACILLAVFNANLAYASGAAESVQPEVASAETALDADSDQTVQEVVVTGNSDTVLLRKKIRELDDARDKILLPKFGATSFNMSEEVVDNLPQGKNTAIDKVLLQAPGVSYDSAVSNPDFHVRNEYANVQYRINGIQLPDGVSALGPILETGFIGNLNLLDGALPAQYGLRTAGVVDLTTKSEFYPGGNLELYGGSWGTVSPSIEVGGSKDQTQYFFTARYLQSDQGLENAMPTENPIHDHTTQGKFFAFGSTLIDDSSRMTYMAGAFAGHFQIPNVAGQTPQGNFGSTNLLSTDINENETDKFFFALVALQTHVDNVDMQFSLFTRQASVHFKPDTYYDLAFNNVASDVSRNSQLSGVQFDASNHLSDTHTVRAGFGFSGEQTQGWNLGGYVQEEWTLLQNLTLNTGLRFDQMQQFVSASQLSPRIALVYKPVTETTLHAGISRFFTPPMQAQASPVNLALFQNTTQQQVISQNDPVKPERATYLDVGVDQKLTDHLSAGADAYYKRSTDTLDDGQFGQAVVLQQYNYEHGFSKGLEFKLNYQQNDFRAYANLSGEITKVKNVASSQYLIGDPVELAYLATTYTYASDAQTVTASFGSSYRWQGILISTDGIYGSGLRAGYANEQHSPAYTQWNAAVAREFDPWQAHNPLTLRISAVNLFDKTYLLRSGTGIGEFAPQYGPRRGLFISLSQQF